MRDFKLSKNGFTLIEFIILIVVLGVVSVYAGMKGLPISETTLPSQAQKFAMDMRQAQTLAYTWGKRMKVTITTTSPNGAYSITCDSAGCGSSNDFSATLEKNISLTGSTLYFNSLGQPSDSTSSPLSSNTTFTLASGSYTETVTVAALTGLITVSP